MEEKTVKWLMALVVIQGIRMVQNFVPLILQIKESKERRNVYAQFIDGLRCSDREWVRAVLEEFERSENEHLD